MLISAIHQQKPNSGALCAAEGFSVSYSERPGRPELGSRLSVKRVRGDLHITPADCDGMIFATTDDARAFAYERGYLRKWYRRGFRETQTPGRERDKAWARFVQNEEHLLDIAAFEDALRRGQEYAERLGAPAGIWYDTEANVYLISNYDGGPLRDACEPIHEVAVMCPRQREVTA